MPQALTATAGFVAAAGHKCLHCLGPLGRHTDEFCCTGCATAYAVIRGLGLEAFYRQRQVDIGERALVPEPSGYDFAGHARTADDDTASMDLLVDGMNCAACLWLIESVLARDPTVLAGRVTLGSRRLRIRWRGGVERANEIASRVTALGFRLAPFRADDQVRADAAEERLLLRAMAVAGFAAGNVMLLSVSVWSGHDGEMGAATRDLLHWVSALIGLPAIAYAGRPFFKSAFEALRAGRTNMDVPISVGVILAAAMSLAETMRSGPYAYFDSALTLLFFLLIGRYLERRMRLRAHSAASRMAALATRDISVIQPDGNLRTVPASAAVVGDRVLVAAGERIAVDGTVDTGETWLDCSLITGESVPQAARPGDQVFAGALNQDRPITVRAIASGDRTLLADVARLMETAENARGRYCSISERLSRLYAPVVHLTAALTFVGWLLLSDADWQVALLNAVTVLIITCPCALGLAVPAVQIVATGRLFRHGILLKSGTGLERMAGIDSIVFDKTGTLTLGHASLIESEPTPRLERAAALARCSRHPLARALARGAPPGPSALDAVEHPGQGVSVIRGEHELRLGRRDFCEQVPGTRAFDGTLSSDANAAERLELWFRDEDGTLARYTFHDRLRPDASEVVESFKARKIALAIVSGDRPESVAAVAGILGIADHEATAMPARKVERLQAAAAAGHRTLMVGDGLNDGPALSAAHVSMSPGSAADITQAAADFVFQGERLGAVMEAWRTACRADAAMRQNIGFAVLYNLFAVPLAVFGHVTPLVAAIAMSSSSIVVILNAVRLAR